MTLRKKTVRPQTQTENIRIGIYLDGSGRHARVLPIGGGSPLTMRVPEHISTNSLTRGMYVIYNVVGGEHLILSAYDPNTLETTKATTLGTSANRRSVNLNDLSGAIKLVGGTGISVVTDHANMTVRIELDGTIPFPTQAHLHGLQSLTFGNGAAIVSSTNGITLASGHFGSLAQDLDTGWHLQPGGEWRFLRRHALSYGPDFTPDEFTWYGPSGIPMFRATPTSVMIGLPFSDAYIQVDLERGLRINGSAIEVGTLSAETLDSSFIAALGRKLLTEPLRPAYDRAAFVSFGETFCWGAHDALPAVLADEQAFRLGIEKPIRVTPDGRVSVPPETLAEGELWKRIFLGQALFVEYGGIHARHPQRDWFDRYQARWDASSGEFLFAGGLGKLDAVGLHMYLPDNTYPYRYASPPEMRWYLASWPDPVTHMRLNRDGSWELHHRGLYPTGGLYGTGYIRIDNDMTLGNRVGNVVLSVPPGKDVIVQLGTNVYSLRAFFENEAPTLAASQMLWLPEADPSPVLQLGRGESTGFMDVRDGDLWLNAENYVVVNAAGMTPVGEDATLGAPNRRWRTVHAHELRVGQLVSQQIVATVGGQIVVAPTSQLARNVDTTTTAIFLAHPIANTNDILYLENNGLVEYMLVTGGPNIGDGYYHYVVQRGQGGTSAQAWPKGTAVVNTRQSGNGWLNLFSDAAMQSGIGGPALAVFRRNSNTPSDYKLRALLGRLSGAYGYDSAERYGVAMGDPDGIHITIDDQNGIRFRQGSVVLARWNTDGIWLGQASNLSGLGNLAFKNTAVWGTDISSIPTRFSETPSSPGLYVTASAMGYWDGSQWRSYFDASGNFFLQTGTGNGNYIGMSTTHTTYRLWIGHPDPTQAAFRVTKDGSVTSNSITATGIFSWGNGRGALNNTGFQWQVDTNNKVLIHSDADSGYSAYSSYLFVSGNLANQYLAQFVQRATGEGTALNATKLGSEGVGLYANAPRWAVQAWATYAAEPGRAAVYAVGNSMLFYGQYPAANGAAINLAMPLAGTAARGLNIRFGDGPYYSGVTRGAATTNGHFLGFEGKTAAGNVVANLVVDEDVGSADAIGYLRVYVDDDANRITAGSYYVPFCTLKNSAEALRLHDDFVGGGLATAAIGELGWSFNAGSVQRTTVVSHRPGVIRRLSSTTAGEAASLFLGATGYASFTTENFARTTWYVAFENNNADYNARLGVASEPSSDTPTHGIYFERKYNDSQWYAVCRNNNTQTRAATGITFSTSWVRFGIVLRSSNTVDFYINGALVATITTNIPASSTGLHPFVHVVPTSAVTRSYLVDRFDLALSSINR